jgi:universal stress protein A
MTRGVEGTTISPMPETAAPAQIPGLKAALFPLSAPDCNTLRPGSNPPTPTSRTIGTVLLATDLGVTSAEATELAISMAARWNARLLLVNVLDTRRVLGSGRHGRVDQARAEREPLLVDIVQRARSAGVDAEFLLWTGDPAEGILSAVQAESADLLVVGSHGRDGAGRILLGSVSDHLVRNAGCPVLVVRPREADTAFPGVAA